MAQWKQTRYRPHREFHVPEGTPFAAVKKGIATNISYERNGVVAEDFSSAEANNVIELNGIKSELVIDVLA
jgi:hypothetical protein